MKCCCFFFVVVLLQLLSMTGFSQDSLRDSTAIAVEGMIVDAVSRKPIAYAKIYNLQSRSGTISNLEGFFRLEGVTVNDTLQISFVGYERKKIPAATWQNGDTLILFAKSALLPEVEVHPDDPYLYELVANCRKSGTYKTRSAKTYFELESYVNNKQVELVESYYNGTFTGYDVSDLQLKNGRFALAPFGNRMFISTETSKAIYMHKLLEENGYFPDTPLTLSKGKLKKSFSLKLRAKYSDGTSSIYVIDYKPRDTLRTSFEGRIWVDSLSGHVLRIVHNIENAAVHPFMMIAREDQDGLIRADLQISKTYQELDGKMYVNAIDFSYQLQYKYRDKDSIQTVSTNAILYAYDYHDAFTLPFFEFTDGMYGDYVKIMAAPYNEFFWRNIDEFKFSDLKNRNESFFREYGNYAFMTRLSPNGKDTIKGHFEKPYKEWSTKRILFREDLQQADSMQAPAGAVPAQMYNLKVQLYMDVNYFNDSLQFLTATVFDPFETFYYYPINNVSLTFINIYFDLMEIQRRELESDILKNAKNAAQISEIYKHHLETASLIGQQYLREVDRGTNKENLLKWNQVVADELKIDNVMLFNPYPQEEAKE